MQAELDRLVADFLAVNDRMGLERLDGEEVSFERMQEAVQSLPFLVSRKLVVLRSPGMNKTFTEQVEQIFADVPENTDVVLLEPKLDKRSSYYKYLKKHTEYREFPELDGRGLAQWLVAEAKTAGGSLSLGDATYLVNRVGTNQQILANELDKLLIYGSRHSRLDRESSKKNKSAARSTDSNWIPRQAEDDTIEKITITRADIDLLTDMAPQSTIFELLEAAFAGNMKRAMALYEEQRELKVEPQQIIAMLAWQLHILALVKAAGERSTDDIAREARLNPFVVRKSIAVARRISLAKLKQLITKLTIIDARLKREPLNPDDVLQEYLLSLS